MTKKKKSKKAAEPTEESLDSASLQALIAAEEADFEAKQSGDAISNEVVEAEADEPAQLDIQAADEPTDELAEELTALESAAIEEAVEASVAETEDEVAPESTESVAAAPALDATAEAPLADATKITDEGEILLALEGIIFAAPKAISLLRLRNLLGSFNYAVDALPELLAKLEEKHANNGFQLVKVAGGYQFRSHPKNGDLLSKMLEDKPARLGGSALEVLAIIAYKQPVTRSEIDAVRGIDSGHLMKGLLEKDLVRTDGHAETPGRPLLYATSPYFLEVFGLHSLDDLPAMDEFNRELVKNDAGDAAAEGQDGTVYAADPELAAIAAFHGGPSPLAANPDRGQFDEPDEEATTAADFGVEERAREEMAN